MGGQPLNYPTGVLDAVKKYGEDRVTWQAPNGRRFATVAINYQNGYIVGAQSLLETENLIDQLGRLILMAWVACLICMAVGFVVLMFIMKKLNVFTKES